eukprot:3222621-Pleurochrysis_carterae.AAC.2
MLHPVFVESVWRGGGGTSGGARVRRRRRERERIDVTNSTQRLRPAARSSLTLRRHRTTRRRFLRVAPARNFYRNGGPQALLSFRCISLLAPCSNQT